MFLYYFVFCNNWFCFLSLGDIAVSVRRNRISLKPVNSQVSVPVSVQNSQGTVAVERKVLPIIEAPSSPVQRSSGYSRGTSITGIARGIESSSSVANVPGAVVSWEKCKCLKRSGEKLFCTKFMGLCVQDKCPKKYIEN